MQKFTQPIPLSLYIHIPWCVRKCPYCDFNSHEARNGLPEKEYIACLMNDLDQQLPRIWGRRLVSIFLGGGTPSLFSAGAIESILMGVNQRLPFHSDIEITLEANPGTLDEGRFAGFRNAGVNRLSIGIQSLQNEKLLALGRIHNRDYALAAIESAINAGFTQFNLDLMHGLPNQSIDDAMQDLKDALQYQPPHLSWYQLTIEPNTFFHRHPPRLPEEENLWDIQEQGKMKLANADLQQYEVSAYARGDQRCVHNMNYWEFGDYLGIGAGAYSKITDMENQVITRHWRVKNPKDYLQTFSSQDATTQVTTVDEKDVVFEFMLNALRLNSGVSLDLFTERTGLSSKVLEPTLSIAKEKNLLVNEPTILRPTELGHRFLNDLTGLFLTTSA